MTERVLVSIIIRTKNRPTMLARALEDVLAQTSSNWEIIVVNDGGNVDDVDRALAARSGLSGRAHAIHHATSRGMEAASNAGIADAQGEFIAIHDDDDTWHPEFLDRTVRYLQATPHALAVAVPTDIVQERVEGDQFVEISRTPFTPPNDIVSFTDLLVLNRVVPIGMLVRAATIRELNGYDESLDVVGDWEFNLRLATLGSIDYLAGETLAQWRQRPHVNGALANSVHAAQAAHARFDRIVRDRALQVDAREGRLGTALLIARLVDDSERRIMERLFRIEEQLEQQSTAIQAQVSHHSPGAFARRVVTRITGRSRKS